MQLDGVRQQLVAADFFPAGSHDVELLTEMAVFGDAGCFLDQVRVGSVAFGGGVPRMRVIEQSMRTAASPNCCLCNENIEQR